MRRDFQLESFKSNHVYGLADQVYGVVVNGIDFDMEYIDWFWFDDLPARAALPCKQTLLHETIHAVAFSYLEYSTRKFPEDDVPYYAELLSEAGMNIPEWLTEK